MMTLDVIRQENISRYRKNAADCLDHAAQARKAEDIDAWLLIAEEWLRLAVGSVKGDKPAL